MASEENQSEQDASQPAVRQPSNADVAQPSTPAVSSLAATSDKYSFRLQGGFVKTDFRSMNERYRNWRRNSYFLLDFFTANVTPHPSRTVEWLPDIEKLEEEVEIDSKKTVSLEFYGQQFLTGTLNPLEQLKLTTIRAEDVVHCIFQGCVKIPIDDGRRYDKKQPTKYGLNNWGTQAHTKIEIDKWLPVVGGGEVMRARHMPQLSDLVAVRTQQSTTIDLYDLKLAHPYETYPLYSIEPSSTMQLRGPTVPGGYGLAWHQHRAGYVLAGSYDNSLAIWNIYARGERGGRERPTSIEVSPLRQYSDSAWHTAPVQDVAWHSSAEFASMFASVGDDCRLCIGDIRCATPATRIRAHTTPVNCVAFAPPTCAAMLATGACDGTIALWDLRRMDMRLHTIAGCHMMDIVQLKFNDVDPLILASSSLDRRVFVYDLGCIASDKQLNDPAADQLPPEVMLAHDGHSAPVNDFSWNPHYERMLLSIADDNVVQVWEIAERLWSASRQRRLSSPLYPRVAADVNKKATSAEGALDAPALPEIVASDCPTHWKVHDAPKFKMPKAPPPPQAPAPLPPGASPTQKTPSSPSRSGA